jgi:hypothetical protein
VAGLVDDAGPGVDDELAIPVGGDLAGRTGSAPTSSWRSSTTWPVGQWPSDSTSFTLGPAHAGLADCWRQGHRRRQHRGGIIDRHLWMLNMA